MGKFKHLFLRKVKSWPSKNETWGRNWRNRISMLEWGNFVNWKLWKSSISSQVEREIWCDDVWWRWQIVICLKLLIMKTEEQHYHSYKISLSQYIYTLHDNSQSNRVLKWCQECNQISWSFQQLFLWKHRKGIVALSLFE